MTGTGAAAGGRPPVAATAALSDMTVKWLIEQLGKMPPEAIVYAGGVPARVLQMVKTQHGDIVKVTP